MRKIQIGDKVRSNNATDKAMHKTTTGEVSAIRVATKWIPWTIEVELDKSLGKGLYFEDELEVIDEKNADV